MLCNDAKCDTMIREKLKEKNSHYERCAAKRIVTCCARDQEKIERTKEKTL